MSDEPIWVESVVVRKLHQDQLDSYGGLGGIRDDGMLESALGKPLNQWHYENANIFRLASSYAFGIANNHPFVDGNKRTAFVTSVMFLDRNGYELLADEVEAATVFLALAAGELTELELADWFEANSKKIDP